MGTIEVRTHERTREQHVGHLWTSCRARLTWLTLGNVEVGNALEGS